jgi:sugar lactone lactonase YvrE
MTLCSSFYSTNDHYYYNGFRRTLEDKYAPFGWASHVIHCDGSGAKTICQKIHGDYQYANGILLTEDGNTLLVNDLYEGTTLIHTVDEETHDVILERKVVSLTPSDFRNISVDRNDVASGRNSR